MDVVASFCTWEIGQLRRSSCFSFSSCSSRSFVASSAASPAIKIPCWVSSPRSKPSAALSTSRWPDGIWCLDADTEVSVQRQSWAVCDLSESPDKPRPSLAMPSSFVSLFLDALGCRAVLLARHMYDSALLWSIARLSFPLLPSATPTSDREAGIEISCASLLGAISEIESLPSICPQLSLSRWLPEAGLLPASLSPGWAEESITFFRSCSLHDFAYEVPILRH